MVLESFGLEKHVEKHLNSAKNRFQLFKYKGLADNTDEYIGIDSHIDRHFLTILCQNDVVDGLEIKTKDGEDWIKAKPSQDSSFLVLVGASLHVKQCFLESQVSSVIYCLNYVINMYITYMNCRYC